MLNYRKGILELVIPDSKIPFVIEDLDYKVTFLRNF